MESSCCQTHQLYWTWKTLLEEYMQVAACFYNIKWAQQWRLVLAQCSPILRFKAREALLDGGSNIESAVEMTDCDPQLIVLSSRLLEQWERKPIKVRSQNWKHSTARLRRLLQQTVLHVAIVPQGIIRPWCSIIIAHNEPESLKNSKLFSHFLSKVPRKN